ncbi:MAG: ribosome silencing factor [Prevotellaceae bacterium]|jgi:ribosome-associated protein|nr:ribosome silencing factor [Prevotellaceae bacterium]
MTKKVAKKEIREEKETLGLLDVIVEAMFEKKAENIISLDLSSLDNSVCKYFVICNADSTTQVSAIAENVEDRTRERLGERVWRKDGFENSLWVVLDYGDIVVHVFQTECRNFYRLENLWADAELKRYADDIK